MVDGKNIFTGNKTDRVGVYRLNRSGEPVRSHDHHHLVPFLQTIGFSTSKREPS